MRSKSFEAEFRLHEISETTSAASIGSSQLLRVQDFRSRILRRPRNLSVYLPPGYAQQTERRFPVLYLQDGQNLFDPATSFVPGSCWRVGETADRLIGSGAVQPLIIVGIDHGGKRRIREYTPTRVLRLGGGSAKQYGRMLIEEILPYINARFRTRTGPENTGLGGSSLGGLVSLQLGLRFPKIFGKLAALSPSVWWGGRWLHRFTARVRVNPRPRIWLDIGAAEEARSVQAVALYRDVLVERGWVPGFDLCYEAVPGAAHNEAAWAERVGPFLQFLFPAREAAV